MPRLTLEHDGIECHVQNPEKHGDTPLNSYSTFEISSKTTWPQFAAKEFFVRRRFNDFLWLRTALCSKFPHVIVPPLPDKDAFSYLDRFSAEFLEKRQVGLQSFLTRTLDHPLLRESPLIVTFLETKNWALETAKHSGAPEAPSYMSSARKVYKSVSTGVDDVVTTRKGSRELDPNHDQFENLRNYVSKFEDHMPKAQDVARRLGQRHREIQADYLELGPAFQLLAQSEEELCEAFRKIGECSKTLSEHYDEQVTKTELAFVEPLKEYCLIAAAARDMLRGRDEAMRRYVGALGALEQLKADKVRLDQAVANPVPRKKGLGGYWDSMFSEEPEQALAKTVEKIGETEGLIVELNGEVNIMSEQAQKEMERFHSIKCQDFKQMLLLHVRQQVEFHTKVQETWASMLPHIQNIQVGHSTNPSGSSILGLASSLN